MRNIYKSVCLLITFIVSTQCAWAQTIVTIDLNNCTLDRGLTAQASYGQVITVRNGSTLNLSNGTLTGGYGGDGDLQVFDVMGRLVIRKHVDGVETLPETSLHNGVYIFRLNEKTQKIVVK